MNITVLALITIALLIPAEGLCSQRGKNSVSLEAYEQWNDIVSPQLSQNGEWAAYILSSRSSYKELVIRATRREKEFRVLLQAASEHLAYGAATTEWEASTYVVSFSADSRYVTFFNDPLHARTLRADASFSNGLSSRLGILRLLDGQLTDIPSVLSFSMPEQSGRYLAYIAEEDAGQSKRKTLIVRDLLQGTLQLIRDVTEFTFDPAGHVLAYAILSPINDSSGIYLRRLVDGYTTTLVRQGRADYRSLCFDRAGKQFSFLSNKLIQANGEGAEYAVYYARAPWKSAEIIVNPAERNLRMSLDNGLRFTSSGEALVFRTTEDSIPLELDDRARFDLWHWKEATPISQGKRTVTAEALAYLTVYYISTRRWMQLESRNISEVLLSDDANYAIGIDRAPYRLQNKWSGPVADVYLLDVPSGASRLFRKGLQAVRMWRPRKAFVAFSPGGRYVVFFENRRWFVHDLQRGKLTDLTGAMLPAIAFDAEGSPPGQPGGIAGWTPDDRSVLVYSRSDIWEFDPQGRRAPRDITHGIGREENIVFRLWADARTALDYPWGFDYVVNVANTPVIDPSRRLLLAALDRDSMASGIWKGWLGGTRPPEQLFMDDKRVTPISQVESAEQYLLSIESFNQFPDLWTGSNFDQLKRISDANPQQVKYSWGTAELVDFVSDFEVHLKGRLYKPADFDPSVKYPMIVSMYERESHRLHMYARPWPLTAAETGNADLPSLVSEGYIVFSPDVESVVPYPGQSAVAAVIPGVQAILDRGFVDLERIGVAGHSFGGFEVVFLITHTDRFRCAVESAGPVNLLSGYSAISSGPYFFEHGQMRQGSSVWERPLVYLENSPILQIHHVKVPLLIMHNDKDKLVPFAQGMELFTALRRNGKEAYLFNYRGEGHRLSRYKNALDWDARVRQFFNHCLKGAKKPDWMVPSNFSLPIKTH